MKHYLQGIADGQSYDARTKIGSTNHCKESCKEYDAVPNTLKSQGKPSASICRVKIVKIRTHVFITCTKYIKHYLDCN